MPTRLQLAEITAQLVRKKIKHLHLRVLPPDGAVRISAPQRMDLETIRRFALSKLDWIRAQRAENAGTGAPGSASVRGWRKQLSVWGKNVPLRVIESPQAPAVALLDDRLVMRVRPGSPKTKKQAVLDAWYREQVKQARPAAHRLLGSAAGGKSEALLRATHENPLGQLQYPGAIHPPQHPPGRAGPALPGVCGRARAGAPAGGFAQCAF
jgi:predicted metal-dependent hydrolase